MRKNKIDQCSEHSDGMNKCIYFDMSTCKNVCAKCVTQQRSQPQNLILIEDLLSDKKLKIIDNWPILDKDKSQNIQKDLKYIVESIETQDIFILITKYYEAFKMKIVQHIDESYKKQIQRSQILDKLKEDVLFIYSNVAESDQLKQLWQDSCNNESNYKNLNKFISTKNKLKQVNSNLLEQSLLKYRERLDLFCFDQSNLIQQKIIEGIKKIDIFIVENLEDYFQQLDSIYTEKREQKSQNPVQKLMKLINNKSNFCNTQFLSDVQNNLNKVKHHLERIDFQKMHAENEQPIDFSLLQNQQLTDISRLIKEYDHFQSIMPQSNTDYNEFKRLFVSSNDSLGELMKMLFLCNNYYRNITLNSLSMTKSSFQSQKNDSQIKRKDDNLIEIIKYDGYNTTIAYSNFILNPKVKYTFRYQVDYHQKDGNYKVGLIPDSSRNTQHLQIYYLHNQQYSLKPPQSISVVKGDFMNNYLQFNQFEIRICIQDNYIEIADYPHYTNINKINHLFKGEEYRIAFELSPTRLIKNKTLVSANQPQQTVTLFFAECANQFNDKFQ